MKRIKGDPVAVLAALLMISGAIFAGYRFYTSSQEATEAKRRLQADLATQASRPTERILQNRRFGTDEERNLAESVPYLAPAIQRLLAEEAK